MKCTRCRVNDLADPEDEICDQCFEKIREELRPFTDAAAKMTEEAEEE